jgi:hypothetical protein
MKLGYAIPHEIRIRASANMGFIVKIGCGEFVVVNEKVLLDDLQEYLKDPKKWEGDYNKMPGNPQEVATTDPTPEAPLAPTTE